MFYRDGLGFTELGRFDDHDGYSGAFLGVPGTRAHLEFTAGGDHALGVPHPETLTVLYLGSQDAVDAAIERLGARTVASANPYWDRIVAATVLDPDGFRVVLAPRTWHWPDSRDCGSRDRSREAGDLKPSSWHGCPEPLSSSRIGSGGAREPRAHGPDSNGYRD